MKRVMFLALAMLLPCKAISWAEEFDPEWQTVNSSNPPTGRYGHSMNTLPDGTVLIFGGEDGQGVTNNLFALVDNGWNPVPLATAPKARRSHAAWVKDGKLSVHGGSDSDSKPLDDLWSYDHASKKWSAITPGGTAKPSARQGHSATLLADGSVILFGGQNAQNNNLAELWKLNSDYTYTQLGSGPYECAGHTAQLVDDLLVVLGLPGVTAIYDTTALHYSGPVSRKVERSGGYGSRASAAQEQRAGVS